MAWLDVNAAPFQPKTKVKSGPCAANPVLKARVDKCAWCEEQKQGWCDNSLKFYCERCWGDYDALKLEDGENYVGSVWHDQILEEDNLIAENDGGDGKDLLEFTRNALLEMDADDCEDDMDDIGPLPSKFSMTTKVSELLANALPEVKRAHVIVMVDISGSMRTNDVKSDKISTLTVTRMAAVEESLRTFFGKQVASESPHRFSLLSFSEQSRAHFIMKTALEAKAYVSTSSNRFQAKCGTHFVQGLAGAKKIINDGLRTSAADVTPHLIIFSDGRPADGPQMIRAAQTMLREFASLHIHAIGFGDGLEFELLQRLTSIGRGAFAPSARSLTALHAAFASVTSTITATQTVTSRSSKSSAYSFQGQQAQSRLTLRDVTFEAPNQFCWSNNAVSFKTRRNGENGSATMAKSLGFMRIRITINSSRCA